MKRFTGILIPLLIACLFVTNVQAARIKGVALYKPLGGDYLGCSYQTQVTDFFEALNEGGWTGNYVAYWNFNVSDSPVGTAEDLVRDTNNNQTYKNFFSVAHSSASRWQTDEFATVAARNNRVAYYRDTLHWNENYLVPWGTAPGPYYIDLRDTGIQNLIGGCAADTAMFMFVGCNSYSLRAYFCRNLSDYGQAFVGSPSTIPSDLACNAVNWATRQLSCQLWDESFPTLFDNSIGETVPYLAGVQLDGWGGNRLNVTKDCQNWAVSFFGPWYFDGAVHWADVGEDERSKFIVRKYNSFAHLDRPDTVAVVSGRGSDGTGIIRAYSLQVDGSGVLWDVVEVDNWGKKTVSKPAIPGRPENWDEIVALDDRSIEEPGTPGGTDVFELVPEQAPFQRDSGPARCFRVFSPA
jgi:hypothetical protein